MEKIALITGASKGIGKSFAQVFAKNGYSLILIARNLNELQQLQQDLKNKYQCNTQILSVDLAKPESISIIMETFKNQMEQVEVLVNNAGFGIANKFTDVSTVDTMEMIQVNISALTGLTHAVLPYMQAKKSGKILNVASIAGFTPGPYMAVYYATKAYVVSFSEALYEEYKNDGIQVSVLCPGVTLTSFQKRAGMQDTLMMSGNLYSKMSADSVCEIAYKGLQKNKRVIIPGIFNRLSVISICLTPSWLAAKITARLQKHR